jgi:hypothetical protein
VIFLAEALQNLGLEEEARKHLDSLKFEEIDNPAKVDHCLAFASVADLTSKADRDLLALRLDALEVPYPTIADSIHTIRRRIDSITRQELEESLRELRGRVASALDLTMTPALAQRGLAYHRGLPPAVQAETLPRPRDLELMLTEVLVYACATLQDEQQILSVEARSLEDTYTAFLASLVAQRVAEFGWFVGEQDLGGLPASASKERGRRDLVFRKDGDAPFGIVEAVLLDGTGKRQQDSIGEHLVRLATRYDRCGGAQAIMLVYAKTEDFKSFLTWYGERLRSMSFEGARLVEGPNTKEEWARDGLVRRNIGLLRTVHIVSREDVPVTHVLVRV